MLAGTNGRNAGANCVVCNLWPTIHPTLILYCMYDDVPMLMLHFHYSLSHTLFGDAVETFGRPRNIDKHAYAHGTARHGIAQHITSQHTFGF